MFARGALQNPSNFSKTGQTNLRQVIEEYIKLCVDVQSPYQNTKYVTLQMLPNHTDTVGERVTRSRSLRDIWYVLYYSPFIK